VALGNLFCGRKITARRDQPRTYATWKERWSDPDYHAERAAFLVLRLLAYREEDRFGDWELALLICQNSPAQIRGYLTTFRDGKCPAKRGRPKKQLPRQRSITDYQINKCFDPVLSRSSHRPYNNR
jgi:hypothetical protein